MRVTELWEADVSRFKIRLGHRLGDEIRISTLLTLTPVLTLTR